MTKSEIISTLRGLVRSRGIAFKAMGYSDKHPQRQVVKQLTFWMPKDTWTLQRLVRFVCNNREMIIDITPHTERFHKYRTRIQEFLSECEILNYNS